MSIKLGNIPDIHNGSFDVKFLAHFAKAKDVFPHVDQQFKPEPPPFEGTVDAFIAKHNNDPELQRQMKNKVRKCPNCSKPNAFTLPFCNQCGAAISNEPISFSDNVFMGFVYGIQKGPFPFTISMRFQDKDFIVIDDLLALTPCHLNCIPTSKYIPDFRYLLKRPKDGLVILNNLFDISWRVLEEQFWNNEAWRKKIIKNADSLKVGDLKAHVAAGLNYPPSQYQLHLQFMLPPFLPFQYFQCLNGVHFTPGRFFPYEYVRSILQLNEPYDLKEDTPVEVIIEHYKGKGVDYDAVHKVCYDRYQASHQKLANWSKEDFAAVIVNDKVYQFKDGDTLALTTDDTKTPRDADKITLQNYGRPYKDGKPTGTYYQHAKQSPKDIESW